jgi:hypothetical protein
VWLPLYRRKHGGSSKRVGPRALAKYQQPRAANDRAYDSDARATNENKYTSNTTLRKLSNPRLLLDIISPLDIISNYAQPYQFWGPRISFTLAPPPVLAQKTHPFPVMYIPQDNSHR